MKRNVISILCILAGMTVAAAAAFSPFEPELVQFIGAAFVGGGFIYLDSKWMKRVVQREGKAGGKFLIRLAVYFALGVLFVLAPSKMQTQEVWLRVFKAVGEALLVTSLWSFFSYTTVKREEI